MDKEIKDYKYSVPVVQSIIPLIQAGKASQAEVNIVGEWLLEYWIKMAKKNIYTKTRIIDYGEVWLFFMSRLHKYDSKRSGITTFTHFVFLHWLQNKQNAYKIETRKTIITCSLDDLDSNGFSLYDSYNRNSENIL